MTKRTKKMDNQMTAEFDGSELGYAEQFEEKAQAEISASEKESLFRACVFVASKLGCEHEDFEIGQAGPCKFNLEIILQIMYRLDAPMSDAEVAKLLQVWKRKSLLVNADKRGWYVCNSLMQMRTDNLLAELDRARAERNRPTKAAR